MGVLHLDFETFRGARECYRILGLHGEHDMDGLISTLGDATSLLPARDSWLTTLIGGDYNIDFTPEFKQDPSRRRQGRRQHHRDRRSLLKGFRDAHKLDLKLAEGMHMADGEWINAGDESTAEGIYTRMPAGAAALTSTPSCIDYFLVSRDLKVRTWGTWETTPSDHAMVVVDVRQPLKRPIRPKRKWRCRHWQAAVEWAAAHTPSVTDLQGWTEYAAQLQDMWHDSRSCAQRRRDRNPYEIRFIAQWAARGPDPLRRAARRRHARAARRRLALREDT